MSTTNRIVLLDSTGDELFSGGSVLSERPEPTSEPPTLRLGEAAPILERERAQEEEEEPIPETLRSSVFIRAHEPVSRPIVIEEAGAIEEADHCAA